MDNITIPDKALKKAAFEAAVAIHRVVEIDVRANDLTEEEVTEIVRAACLAMLRAWPGMHVGPAPADARRNSIMLPLPQKETSA